MKDITLLHGDCLQLMKDIPDGSVDMVLCDPPYGKTRCKWDTAIPFGQLWEQYERIVKPNGAIVLFSAEPFTSALVMSNPKLFRYDLIWQKTSPSGFLNANRCPLRSHENICVFYKKPPTYNPQKTFGHDRKVSTSAHKKGCKKTDNYGNYRLTSYDSTERYPTSVLRFKSDKQKSAIHPTQKPVALLEWLVKTYTNEGETVLDNCMGSGSTGVACVNTDRRFIGMELDDKYYKIAEERIFGSKFIDRGQE